MLSRSVTGVRWKVQSNGAARVSRLARESPESGRATLRFRSYLGRSSIEGHLDWPSWKTMHLGGRGITENAILQIILAGVITWRNDDASDRQRGHGVGSRSSMPGIERHTNDYRVLNVCSACWERERFVGWIFSSWWVLPTENYWSVYISIPS